MSDMVSNEFSFQPKPAYRVRELGALGIFSPRSWYREIREGRLRARQIGGKTMVVLHRDLMEFLENLPNAAATR